VHAGRGARVLEEFIEPDFPRLYDDARTDFVLEHLATRAAEIVGEEIVETGRFPGIFVRAVGRTSKSNTVAAIVVPDGERDTRSLEKELDELREAMGGNIHKLVYGMTSRADRPLEVELVPKGELL
jgi:hypothetical protein